jgi:hypothetical protein
VLSAVGSKLHEPASKNNGIADIAGLSLGGFVARAARFEAAEMPLRQKIRALRYPSVARGPLRMQRGESIAIPRVSL